jgi:hypothetical protein
MKLDSIFMRNFTSNCMIARRNIAAINNCAWSFKEDGIDCLCAAGSAVVSYDPVECDDGKENCVVGLTRARNSQRVPYYLHYRP